MNPHTWSYAVRDINNSINLFEDKRKFGTLYRRRPECMELVGRIETLLVRVSKKGG